MSSLLFDRQSFTPILPFGKDNPLNPSVQSDHAEIALKVAEKHIINIWNISNPAYHCYFKYGEKPPFHNSHLFVDKPFVDGVMDKGLSDKEADQIATIAERFVKGDVNVQVIVEGYLSFYNELVNKIKALGHKEFKIVIPLEQKKVAGNVTGILIDTSRFSLLDSGALHGTYLEVQDSNKQQDFSFPFAHLSDKTSSHSMMIAGVHVNGCGSQYPQTGLELVPWAIKELYEKAHGNSDVIAAGDYNTPPSKVEKSVMNFFGDELISLNAPYPTHVNPKSEAANYDQITILKTKGLTKYEMLPASHLSIASQKFIESIENSRKKLLLDALTQMK